MKFYMVVNYYLVILCIKFHSAWCINARARVVNARNRDKMYGNAAKRAHARLQIVCARVCMDLYEKSFDDSLLSYHHIIIIGILPANTRYRLVGNGNPHLVENVGQVERAGQKQIRSRASAYKLHICTC